MRKGSANTASGTKRFVEELVARCRRAGAISDITLRVDSGIWSNDTIKTLSRLGVRYTMAVRTNTKGVAAAIAGIKADAWVPIDYTEDGVAEVAETIYKGRRLIVRRTRLVGPQERLWPDWRHFAFLTDLDGDAVSLDQFHRDHAGVELAIRDLKEGAGMEHVPSGHFFANSAWLCCAVLAHDLVRWCAPLGAIVKEDTVTVSRTIRTRYFYARTPREPRRPSDAPHARSLAMGGIVHESSRATPAPPSRPGLTGTGGPAQPQTSTHVLTSDIQRSLDLTRPAVGPRELPEPSAVAQ